jgi:hypothetical protein
MRNIHVGVGLVAGTNSGIDQLADPVADLKTRERA